MSEPITTRILTMRSWNKFRQDSLELSQTIDTDVSLQWIDQPSIMQRLLQDDAKKLCKEFFSNVLLSVLSTERFSSDGQKPGFEEIINEIVDSQAGDIVRKFSDSPMMNSRIPSEWEQIGDVLTSFRKNIDRLKEVLKSQIFFPLLEKAFEEYAVIRYDIAPSGRSLQGLEKTLFRNAMMQWLEEERSENHDILKDIADLVNGSHEVNQKTIEPFIHLLSPDMRDAYALRIKEIVDSSINVLNITLSMSPNGGLKKLYFLLEDDNNIREEISNRGSSGIEKVAREEFAAEHGKSKAYNPFDKDAENRMSQIKEELLKNVVFVLDSLKASIEKEGCLSGTMLYSNMGEKLPPLFVQSRSEVESIYQKDSPREKLMCPIPIQILMKFFTTCIKDPSDPQEAEVRAKRFVRSLRPPRPSPNG